MKIKLPGLIGAVVAATTLASPAQSQVPKEEKLQVQMLEQKLTVEQEIVIADALGITLEELTQLQKKYEFKFPIKCGKGIPCVVVVGQTHTGPDTHEDDILKFMDEIIVDQTSQYNFFEYLKQTSKKPMPKCIYMEGYTPEVLHSIKEIEASYLLFVKIISEVTFNTPIKNDEDFSKKIETIKFLLSFIEGLEGYHAYGENILAGFKKFEIILRNNPSISPENYKIFSEIERPLNALVKKRGKPNKLVNGGAMQFARENNLEIACASENSELLAAGFKLTWGNNKEKHFFLNLMEFAESLHKLADSLKGIDTMEQSYRDIQELADKASGKAQAYLDRKKKVVIADRNDHAVSLFPRNSDSFFVIGSRHLKDLERAVAQSNLKKHNQIGMITLINKEAK